MKVAKVLEVDDNVRYASVGKRSRRDKSTGEAGSELEFFLLFC